MWVPGAVGLAPWKRKSIPFAAFPPAWALTWALALLTGRAPVARAAVAGAGVPQQDGLPVVVALPAAAGAEFQQELIQSPLQVLPLALHVAQVAPAQDFVDGLQLQGDGDGWHGNNFKLGINWDAVTLLDKFRTREGVICLPRQLHVHHANVLLPQ